MKSAAFAVASVLALSVGPAQAQESQVEALRAASKASASDPLASLALGRTLRRAGHPAEALIELRRGLPLAAHSPGVLVQLQWEVARSQMDRGDFLGARAACGAVAKLPNAVAQGHTCLAQAHLVRQRATEALAESAAAMAADPRCYEAKLAEGRAYDLALDPTRGELAYRTAIAWRPDGAEAHLGLGRVLLGAGEGFEGRVELRRAVDLDPHDPEALYELAKALPPGPESLAFLERATSERPSFGEAWLALGAQELAAGSIASAQKAAEAATRSDGKNVAPHVLSGKVALAEGKPDDAIREGETALKFLANSASAKLLIADANAKKGEIDRALEAYQAAWGLDRADPTALVHASEACRAAGRNTSARAFGVKATQEFPEWGPAWAALGDALAAQKDHDAARDAYAKAISSGGGALDRDEIRRKMATLR
jgi:tetratricopeptide (TPR) repeat protein